MIFWSKGILPKNDDTNIMRKIKIKDEYIKLGQALKLAGIAGSGVDAKMIITDGLVSVNGDICTMRGKKLYAGDWFEYDNDRVKII